MQAGVPSLGRPTDGTSDEQLATCSHDQVAVVGIGFSQPHRSHPLCRTFHRLVGHCCTTHCHHAFAELHQFARVRRLECALKWRLLVTSNAVSVEQPRTVASCPCMKRMKAAHFLAGMMFICTQQNTSLLPSGLHSLLRGTIRCLLLFTGQLKPCSLSQPTTSFLDLLLQATAARFRITA